MILPLWNGIAMGHQLILKWEVHAGKIPVMDFDGNSRINCCYWVVTLQHQSVPSNRDTAKQESKKENIKMLNSCQPSIPFKGARKKFWKNG